MAGSEQLNSFIAADVPQSRGTKQQEWMTVTMAFSDPALETLEVMKLQLHYSTGPSSHKPTQMQGDTDLIFQREVSKNFGIMFYDCHNGFLNPCILYHSLEEWSFVPINMSAHKLFV